MQIVSHSIFAEVDFDAIVIEPRVVFQFLWSKYARVFTNLSRSYNAN